MSDELNRAAPIAAQLDAAKLNSDGVPLAFLDWWEAWSKSPTLKHESPERIAMDGWLACLAAQHQAAQLDAELPPLPDEQIIAIRNKVGERHNSAAHVSASGAIEFARTIEQEVRAQYAELLQAMDLRISDLEWACKQKDAEKAEWKAAMSIDTLEFRVLLTDVCAAYNSGLSVGKRERALIAYIDGRTAGTAPEAAPEGSPLDVSAITSIVKQERGGSHSLIVRFRSKKSADQFLDEFGTIVLADRAAAPSLSGTEEAKP